MFSDLLYTFSRATRTESLHFGHILKNNPIAPAMSVIPARVTISSSGLSQRTTDSALTASTNSLTTLAATCLHWSYHRKWYSRVAHHSLDQVPIVLPHGQSSSVKLAVFLRFKLCSQELDFSSVLLVPDQSANVRYIMCVPTISTPIHVYMFVMGQLLFSHVSEPDFVLSVHQVSDVSVHKSLDYVQVTSRPRAHFCSVEQAAHGCRHKHLLPAFFIGCPQLINGCPCVKQILDAARVLIVVSSRSPPSVPIAFSQCACDPVASTAKAGGSPVVMNSSCPWVYHVFSPITPNSLHLLCVHSQYVAQRVSWWCHRRTQTECRGCACFGRTVVLSSCAPTAPTLQHLLGIPVVL